MVQRIAGIKEAGREENDHITPVERAHAIVGTAFSLLFYSSSAKRLFIEVHLDGADICQSLVGAVTVAFSIWHSLSDFEFAEPARAALATAVSLEKSVASFSAPLLNLMTENREITSYPPLQNPFAYRTQCLS